jgi:predicted nucleic acid-binding protein
VIYCDSSFVVALFVQDVWAAHARNLAGEFAQSIPLVPIGEVELLTRVHRAVPENRITVSEQNGTKLRVIWNVGRPSRLPSRPGKSRRDACSTFLNLVPFVSEHAAVLRQIEEDIADGVLVRKGLPPREHLEEALRLSRRHAPKIAVRSLDILHVAAARVLKSKAFASFDRRQRELAAVAGLRLLPVKLS